MTIRFATAAALTASLLVAACGGGGGGDASPAAAGGTSQQTSSSGGQNAVPTTYNVASAWQNLLNLGGQWTGLVGTGDDGVAYSIDLALTRQADSAFPPNGVTYGRMSFEATTTAAGAAPSTNVVEYFVDSNAQLQGFRNIGTPDECEQTRTGSSAAAPTAAALGDAGALATLDRLSGCSPPDILPDGGTETVRWSVSSDAGFTFLCLDSAVADQQGQPYSSESDCVEINADGSLASSKRARIVLTFAVAPGAVGLSHLTAKNY